MPVPGGCGLNVTELQRELAAAGFDPGPVDGIFGLLTRRAVEAPQRYCGL
ncbi:peptidoglycan-binding domain-containing protein [Desulfofundulus salinus]|uniref:Peptidoglycan-binding protein n=1 Tax=Desulfofundulus salinus TaxID=2419843 RepID=A0A494WWA2_9FIRM|nr:peptidoglycan-binding domain-containing protein [Desulfofundulus salinum]RKO67806.1 peptidoglycan-binding protein [Desulfofundulus salinum]